MWHHNGAPGMKLGEGGRFNKLESKLASEPGVHNPEALAAAIGRRVLGKANFQAMAEKGKENEG